MKKLICIFTVLLFLLSCSDPGISLPRGIHGFDECFGVTAGGSPVCFEWSIQQIDKNVALVNIDGFKTYERLVCSLQQNEKFLEIRFDSFVESEIQKGKNREKGDVLFRIKKDGSDYYVYDVESPETGEIMVREFNLLDFTAE